MVDTRAHKLPIKTDPQGCPNPAPFPPGPSPTPKQPLAVGGSRADYGHHSRSAGCRCSRAARLTNNYREEGAGIRKIHRGTFTWRGERKMLCVCVSSVPRGGGRAGSQLQHQHGRALDHYTGSQAATHRAARAPLGPTSVPGQGHEVKMLFFFCS